MDETLEACKRIIESQKLRIGKLLEEKRDLKSELKKYTSSESIPEITQEKKQELTSANEYMYGDIKLKESVITEKENILKKKTINPENNDVLSSYKEIIDTQKETIKSLKDSLKTKDKLISELEKQLKANRKKK